MRHLMMLLFLFLNLELYGQEAVGKWKTIDDETGKTRSIVEIYEEHGKFYGKITALLLDPEEPKDPICNECDISDPMYKQKIIGMEIIKDMIFDDSDSEYVDGTILDPANGSVYECKIWVSDEGTLKVRGYISFLYRTQTWLPF